RQRKCRVVAQRRRSQPTLVAEKVLRARLQDANETSRCWVRARVFLDHPPTLFTSASNESGRGRCLVLSFPSGPVGSASVPRDVLPMFSRALPRASDLVSDFPPDRSSPSSGSRTSSLSRYGPRPLPRLSE